MSNVTVLLDGVTGEVQVLAAPESGAGDHGAETEGTVTGEHGADTGHEAETAEEPANPILPTGPELFWGATLFTLLWMLMKFVLLPPVTKVMEQRDAKIAADRAAADQAQVDAVSVRSDYEAKLAAARQEGARLVEDARHRAEARRAELVAQADAEISAIRAEAASEVAAAKQATLAEVQGSVADLAIEAAEAVIQKQLDREAQRAFVNDYLSRSGSTR